MLLGARVSLLVGVVVVGVSSLVGMVVGAVSGYYGGRIDQVIGRVTDVLMAFPGMLLAIALVAVLGPSLTNVVIALAVIGWVGYARLVRGQVPEAALSFLGLGVQPPTPSWGTMINGGRVHLLDAPHLAIFPGIFLAIVVLGFNFLGDGLRDAIDPRK